MKQITIDNISSVYFSEGNVTINVRLKNIKTKKANRILQLPVTEKILFLVKTLITKLKVIGVIAGKNTSFNGEYFEIEINISEADVKLVGEI